MGWSTSKIYFLVGIPVTTYLGLEAVQAILDGATLDASQRAEGEDPVVIQDDQEKEKEV